MNKYKAKHMASKKSHLNTNIKHMKKANLLPISSSFLTIVLLLAFVAGTTAYLIYKYSIKNEFTLGNVRPEIIETFNVENKVKEDVQIKNSGNVPIFVRTAVVITWIDNEGKTLYIVPEENVDYSISFSSSSNWIKGTDGYYYYKLPIEVNTNTDILIEECRQLIEYEDKTLEVNILAQGIQDKPFKAVEEAWGVNIINNCISLGGQ